MKKTHGCLVVLLCLLLSWQTAFGYAQDENSEARDQLVRGLTSGQTGSAAGQTGSAEITAMDFYRQGIAYENQAVYGEAINMYTAAIELDPNFTNAYLRRGKAYRIYEISATRDALTDFTSVITLDPKNAEAYYQRGLVNDYIISNEAAKSDMITAAGLGHVGAQQWLLALKKGGTPVVETPTPVVEVATPACHAEAVSAQGFDLAAYLPNGMQPIIYFDFNKFNIKAEGFPVLDEIAAVLKDKLPGAVILAVGHTDNSGTEKYNAGLSLRRAETVKAYLTTKHGIAPERISAEGYGEMAPADTNETEAGRAHNRRTALTGVLQ